MNMYSAHPLLFHDQYSYGGYNSVSSVCHVDENGVGVISYCYFFQICISNIADPYPFDQGCVFTIMLLFRLD